MAESMVSRCVESAERVDTAAIAEGAMLAFRKLSRMPVQVRATCMSCVLAEHCADGCLHRLRCHGRENGDRGGWQTCGERGEGRYCSHAEATMPAFRELSRMRVQVPATLA